MSKLVLYGILLLFFWSCTTKGKEAINRNQYKISYTRLQVDTAIGEIAYYAGYYLCLQENLKIAAFDSSFARNKVIEDALNIFPISYLYANKDTLFITKNEPQLLGYPKYEFYFFNGFEIHKRKYLIEDSNRPVNSRPLFQDSTYDIYANNIGTYGFLVFFNNKQSGKTYSTWSNGPIQVLKFDNSYYITEEGNYKVSPGFRIIRDPTKLINIANDKIAGLIQHFQHLAPSPGVYYKKLADSIENAMIPAYGGSKSNCCIPIYTYAKDSILYSIIKDDSSIYLSRHNNDSLIKIQTIIDTSIEMHRLSYNLINKGHLIKFDAFGGKGIDNKMQQYDNSGFILIQDSSIDFLYYYFHKPYDRY